MLKYFINKLNNLYSIVSSLYYQLKIQFFFNIFNKNKTYLHEETNVIKKNGYIHLKSIIPKNIIDDFLKKKEKAIMYAKENKLIKDYKISLPINLDEANLIFDYVKKNKIIDICRDYLGKIGILNCDINHQTEIDCEISSMQPHHDTRGNDLKIYVWLSNYDKRSHPLYYLNGSNNDFKLYIAYNHHRRKDIPKDKMDKIYGDRGDVVIFDTHGWHSHTKKNTTGRTVLELTVVPKNLFFCNSSDKHNANLDRLM